MVDSISTAAQDRAQDTRGDTIALAQGFSSLRFERSRLRGRQGDGTTLQEFAAKEARENSATEAGQQLLATLALADIVVDNDGSIEDLHRKVGESLACAGIAL